MMLTWYLVMAGTFIGPFEETSCKRAATELMQVAQCKQADYMQLCPVPEHPEAFQVCPHFTFPVVTIK